MIEDVVLKTLAAEFEGGDGDDNVLLRDVQADGLLRVDAGLGKDTAAVEDSTFVNLTIEMGLATTSSRCCDRSPGERTCKADSVPTHWRPPVRNSGLCVAAVSRQRSSVGKLEASQTSLFSFAGVNLPPIEQLSLEFVEQIVLDGGVGGSFGPRIIEFARDSGRLAMFL